MHAWEKLLDYSLNPSVEFSFLGVPTEKFGTGQIYDVQSINIFHCVSL